MKICYINPTFLIRRPIAELIDRLGDTEDVAIFVPKKPFSKVDDSWHNNKSLKKAKVYSYSAVDVPGNFEWPIPVSIYFFVYLFRIFREYEVVHMWTYFYINSFFACLFRLVFRKTRLVMSADTFPGYSFDPGKITFAFKIYSCVFQKLLFFVPDRIHLYGESLKRPARRLAIPPGKIHVIPTGINLERFSQARKRSRAKIGVPQKAFVLIYAGLLVPRKGIDTMLEVMKRVDSNVHLLLVGDGPNAEEYKRQAGNVTFLGWRKDIPELLKMADAVFLPSRGEGLPGIVMEGMAAGLPVVASDIPCTSDLVSKETGYLCDSTECYIKAINSLAEDPSLAKRLGTRGFEKIQNYDWEKLIPEYMRLYS
ncbi:MAG: glycosyltransferase family 4 protein [Candidatus Woesearchaeota archaeon]